MSGNNDGWADASDVGEYEGMSFSRPDPRFAVEDRRKALARAAAQKNAVVAPDKNAGWAADDSTVNAGIRGTGR